MTAPIILVPGFWLGAWAWDEVAAQLRADDHDVTALTLPGLESADADRSGITLEDHVQAICDAVRGGRRPPSSSWSTARPGFSGYAASDRLPERIAAMVYVDTAPGKGALDPDFAGVEKPLVWQDIEAEENLDGLTEEQKETFRASGGPRPGRRPARGDRAHQRRPPRHPEHRDLHRLHGRAVPELRGGASRVGVPRRHSRSCAT